MRDGLRLAVVQNRVCNACKRGRFRPRSAIRILKLNDSYAAAPVTGCRMAAVATGQLRTVAYPREQSPERLLNSVTGRRRRPENRLLIGHFGYDDTLANSPTVPVRIHLPGTLPQTWHLLLPRLV